MSTSSSEARRGVAVLLLLAATGAAGQEARVRLEETVITGSEELPKVLYIVPWQDDDERPSIAIDPSVIEADVFRPLDPTAYRRELERLDALGVPPKR
jgi:hypothetical protein